jgi:hypothetical protein
VTAPPRPKLPEPTFNVLVDVLAAPCLVHLGLAANPASGKVEKDLEQAKWTIDLLHVLEEKTRGNVAAADRARLDQLLHQLRTAYAASRP